MRELIDIKLYEKEGTTRTLVNNREGKSCTVPICVTGAQILFGILTEEFIVVVIEVNMDTELTVLVSCTSIYNSICRRAFSEID